MDENKVDKEKSDRRRGVVRCPGCRVIGDGRHHEEEKEPVRSANTED